MARPVRQGPRIFGVGAAKTGTHSLASMFAPHVPSAHEAWDEMLIGEILRREQTGRSRPLRALLHRRDRRLGLKIDSSQLNIFMLGELADLFPHSRYVLTMRHPIEWLRSMVDDSLRRDIAPVWQHFRDFRFGPRDGHKPGEAPLAALGLYTLDGYLSYWRRALTMVRHAVPAERLLIVETADLHRRSLEIAAFCGIDAFVPDPCRAHAFANPRRFGVLEQIDRRYLREQTEAICGDLIAEFYPRRATLDVIDQLVEKDQTAATAA